METKRDIQWTKPDDIPYDAASPLPRLGGFDEAGFQVIFVDGSVRFLDAKTDEKTLRAFITKSGGESVERQ